MTLGFSKKFKNGKETRFVDKILSSWMYWSLVDPRERKRPEVQADVYPKLHSIREDKHLRWKKGMIIHMVTGNRTKNRVQFAPGIFCKGIQDIFILNKEGHRAVVVDGRRLLNVEVTQLAYNDGFDSEEEFWSYFHGEFIGRIIHWSSIKY